MERLQIWESTEDYKEQFESAKRRFAEIFDRLKQNDFRCTFVGDLRFDVHGESEVWLNDNRPLGVGRYCKTPDDARRIALRHGACGWWTLDDLDAFSQGQGPLVEEAMWDLGYRSSKRDSSQWAKRRTHDGVEAPGKAYWKKRYGKEFMTLDEGEEERLKQLWAMPGENAGAGKTYNIQAGKTGMIYVSLQANPFVGHSAETLWMLAEQIRNRGHIAKQQEGFSTEAQNVRVLAEGGILALDGIPVEGVYIKATRLDERYIESVWPSQIPSSKIFELLDDLPKKVGGLEAKTG